MFRKWFNQAAEIKRLKGQIKHLQGELNISNHELGHISNCYFAEKKYRKEDRKLYLDAHCESSKWKKTALKALAENSSLKNTIQKALDCETPNATVIIQFDEQGEIDYFVNGDVHFYIIDERAPDDRVYEWTSRVSKEVISRLVPLEQEIGSKDDERHGPLEHRIINAQNGKRHLGLAVSND